MSKRISLTVEESRWLVAALETMRDQAVLGYQIILMGKNEANRLIAKVSQPKPELPTTDAEGAK